MTPIERVDPQSIHATSAHERLAFDLSTFGRLIGEYLVFAVAATQGEQHLLRWANPAFRRLVEASGEGFIGCPFAQAVPSARADGTSELLDRVLRTGDEASSPKPAQTVAMGGLRSRSYRVIPLFGIQGRPEGLLVCVDDSTEWMLARERAASYQLREANQRLILAGLKAQEQHEAAAGAVMHERSPRRRRRGVD